MVLGSVIVSVSYADEPQGYLMIFVDASRAEAFDFRQMCIELLLIWDSACSYLRSEQMFFKVMGAINQCCQYIGLTLTI